MCLLRLAVLLASADGRAVREDVRHETLALHDLKDCKYAMLRLPVLLVNADGRGISDKVRLEALVLHGV